MPCKPTEPRLVSITREMLLITVTNYSAVLQLLFNYISITFDDFDFLQYTVHVRVFRQLVSMNI